MIRIKPMRPTSGATGEYGAFGKGRLLHAESHSAPERRYSTKAEGGQKEPEAVPRTSV